MIHELASCPDRARLPVGAPLRDAAPCRRWSARRRRSRAETRSPRHSRHYDSVLSAVDSTRGSRQHACRTIASTARSDRTHRGPDAAAPAALAERNPRRQRRPAAGLTPPASAVGSNVCRSAPQQRRRVRASVASFALVPFGRPAWARCPPIQIPIARMAAAEDWLESFSGSEPTSLSIWNRRGSVKPKAEGASTTRRELIQIGGAAVVTAVAGAVVKSRLAGRETAASQPGRLAMLIDLHRCFGCQACSVACKSENGVPLGNFRSWVSQSYKGRHPRVRKHFLPRMCNHCEKPACVKVCPVGAVTSAVTGQFSSTRAFVSVVATA